MNKKSPKHILLFLIFWGGLFIGIYSYNKNYVLTNSSSPEIEIDIKLKVQEDDVFQLFYRDSIKVFNEKYSQRILVEGSNDFQWIKFSIPDSLNLAQIRFDFGNRLKTSPVEIDKIDFRYGKNIKTISKGNWEAYFTPNSFVTVKEGMVFGRKVRGNRSDPFFISKNLRPLVKQLTEKKSEGKIAVNITLSLVFSTALIFAFWLRFRETQVKVTFEMVFAIIFLLLIASPLMDSIFDLDNTEIQEKRELFAKPKFNYNSIDEYPLQFENYFNDNFGFRDKMISYGGIIKAKIFNTSPREERVIVGNNDMLFYWVDPSRHSYYNNNPFPNNSLEHLGSMLYNASIKADSINADFYVSIYPDKHSVYGENIPYRFSRKEKQPLERVKQLEKFLANTSIDFVPQKQEILEFKTKTNLPLYFKLDSHWNSLGSFKAYQNLINKMGYNLNVSKALTIDDFKIDVNKNYSSGDLLNLMGVDNSYSFFKDTKITFVPKDRNSFKFTSKKGKNGARIITNPNNNKGLSLMIVGDSYTFELLKFLPYHFKEIIFVRGIRINEELIELHHPDVILYGIVERNLENF
ncbi:alginate O-acetyltransferase AlgX-related protein [Flagellimonas oceanensis]|uniref:alginate O-acetyltransferase AlgX-related protein n=1 Tax=Flagellimonas oceanensis TaxID=2499163 RepID=UPI0013DF1DA1|nr:hypothetical protein [Allomuricauda oceanensis]